MKKKNVDKQVAGVGDLVRCDRGGEFSKKGIIWRVTEVKHDDRDRYYGYWQYKLKPLWGLFGAHKRKQSFWTSNVRPLDITDLGRECLELQGIVRELARERGGE